MLRSGFMILAAGLLTVSCASSTVPVGPNGKPLPRLYKINGRETARIQYQMLDAVNALRASAGAQQLQLNAELNAAAATHSRDMSIQSRPWHFGSDGSSPITRAERVGYAGKLAGENISETYETELETLAAWMEDSATRAVLLDPKATDLGFAWFQEDKGKIWWTLVTGYGAATYAAN